MYSAHQGPRKRCTADAGSAARRYRVPMLVDLPGPPTEAPGSPEIKPELDPAPGTPRGAASSTLATVFTTCQVFTCQLVLEPWPGARASAPCRDTESSSTARRGQPTHTRAHRFCTSGRDDARSNPTSP